MNDTIKHTVIANLWLVRLINKIYNLKNYCRFNKIISERISLSIFDYKQLIADIPYAPAEIVIDNNLYGIAHILKEYIGVDTRKSLDAYIEHGVFFGSLVRDDQKIWPVSQNITYGDQRVMHLENSKIDKSIIPIGPYIHYASSLLDDKQLMNQKAKLGRTLLVFPSHSDKSVESQFDIQLFIRKIEEVKKDFDTVLVSLYWLDAQKEDVIFLYESKGYRIVTSGHRFDINFMNRQKTLIMLSDYTMSNNAGTHVGYCVYLNKPHYIFKQDVKDIAWNDSKQKQFDAVRKTDELINSCSDEMNEVIDAFSLYQNEITKHQLEVVDKYWGISHLRTPLDLKNMLIK
jgi:hypothetical protein